MKKALLFLCILLVTILISSCSKNEGAKPEPAPHTVRITASGDEQFSVVILSAASFGSAQTEEKKMTVAKGASFDFTTRSALNSYVFIKLSTDVANRVNYKIYDNGDLADQESNKELGTFSTATVQYMVK